MRFPKNVRFIPTSGLVLVAVILGSFLNGQTLLAQTASGRSIDVPPLPEGLEWLNTDRPLRLAEFRGKFVLLDFWTYCCINCMHILPELKQLEHDYPKNLVVIGVHSAKFKTEKDKQNIHEAIDRYEIEHPVVVDSELKVWRQFGVQAWPSVLLINPEGKLIWGRRGEITAKQVAQVLDKEIPRYRRQKLLDERPISFNTKQQEQTPLRFPGKVLADPAGDRLFIADSNHNRIVVTRLDGQLLDTIGEGQIGRADGDYATAQFNKPQGMALADDVLYVADTENHLIRRVDLKNRQVTTIAGTGVQNRKTPRSFRFSSPLRTALSSPWALGIHGNRLYIAMAGTHQIWWMALSGQSIAPYAGNGREDIVDGLLLPKQAYAQGYSSFAQPSGLASDGTWLYVADSEGSSIRAVPLDDQGNVRTLVGTSGLASARLFTFGDTDGPAGQARLQHPLGIVFQRGQLYVADTYNNKVKRIDPKSGAIQTIAGDGQTSLFNEPAGITVAGGKLFVADTNHHTIRVIDLERENRVSTLSIPGLTSPATSRAR